MRDFERIGADSTGVRVLKQFADSVDEVGDHYCRFAIETVLAGLERLVSPSD